MNESVQGSLHFFSDFFNPQDSTGTNSATENLKVTNFATELPVKTKVGHCFVEVADCKATNI